MKKKVIFIFILLIIAFVMAGIVYYLFEIRPVAIVLLKTDIDPLLAIRGKLIALDYEISRIPFSLLRDASSNDIQAGWHNNDIYVMLEKRGKYWIAVSAYKKRPKEKSVVFLWGKCNSKLNETFYVRYNIDSMILSDVTTEAIKEQKKTIEHISNDAMRTRKPNMIIDVEVILNMQGKARIRRIFVNDRAYGK